MVTHLIRHFFFSRLLGAIMIANVVSLIVLNFFEINVDNTPFVYLLALAAAFSQLQHFEFRGTVSHAQDRMIWLFIAVSLVFLTLTRLTYLSDWLPQNAVIVIADDYARLAELISMTLSDRYPLKHPANKEFLLSFYYASLYPLATLKLLLPFLSLKNIVMLGNFFYQATILLSLFELSHCLFRGNRTAMRIFMFCCTLFGGLDWLTKDPLAVRGEFDWWQMQYHGTTQVLSFFIALYWVIHHFIGFYALILAYAFLFYTKKQRQPHRKQAIVMLLLASGFHASPFSAMSVPFFLFIHRRVVWKKFLRSPATLVITICTCMPLFIYFGKLPSQSFTMSPFRIDFTGTFWIDKILSAPIYFGLVPLIEFAGIPFLLIGISKKLSPLAKKYLAAALGFFVLTYLVAYTGTNNFCGRGMFLPTFVLFALFARYCAPAFTWPPALKLFGRLSPKALVIGVALMLSIGTIKELGDKLYYAVHLTRLYYTSFGYPVPGELSPYFTKIARNPQPFTITLRENYMLDTLTPYDRWKYNLEHFIDHLELNEMTNWEREILRLPREGTFH